MAVKLMGIILNDKTFDVFGYYLDDLSPSSEKLVIWKCMACGIEVPKKYRAAKLNSMCLQCSNKINANTNKEQHSEHMSDWYKTHTHVLTGTKRPQYVIDAMQEGKLKYWASEDSNKQREDYSRRFTGNGNPFYGKKHTSESLSKMRAFQKTNPAIRGRNSNFYGHPPFHGNGKWVICSNGDKVYMRSSWEVKYADYLTKNNIEWQYEPMAFPIEYDGKHGTYTPDFYVPLWDKYVEIKGYWRDDAKLKYDSFVLQYPLIKIELIMGNDLIAMGVNI